MPLKLKKYITMKKLCLLFVSVLTLGITSCSNDDDSSTSASLEGKWEYFEEGVGGNGQELLTPYDHTAGCSKDFAIITATTVTDHSFDMEGTPAACTEETFSTPYTRNGDTLTITMGTESYNAQIVQLDGSTLKIKSSETVQGQTIDYITVYKRVN